LTELGLATNCLTRAKRLVEAERRLGAQQFERTQQAMAAREAALAKLLADPDANLEQAVSAYFAEGV
jgi:hypothetical protein